MNPRSKKQQLRSLFWGGLLPVVIFALIEDYFGTLCGLVAGMVFGGGEILWEWKSRGRVDTITWVGNGLLLILGGVSLLTREGVWFKLQPALIEIGIAVALWVSVLMGKPLCLSLVQKQGGLPSDLRTGLRPGVGIFLERAFRGLTFRMGLFFAVHAGLAVWVAFFGSTAAWAALKGIGLTVSLIVYWVVESLVLRYRIASIP